MIPTPATSIGILVRRYRLARGWTQRELGRQAGLGMRTVSDIERGLSRYLHADTVQQLVATFALRGDAAREFQQAAQMPRAQLPAVPAVPRLPQPVTPFIGRQADLAAAQATLQHPQTRLLTLAGPAGVGKTRLILEIARTSTLDIAWHFVDLSQAVTPAEVVGAVIRQLSIGEQQHQPPLSVLDTWLLQRRVCLILDNFEQVIGASALVEHLLTSHPDLTLCITSRVPLKISSESVQEVMPFSIPTYRYLSHQQLRREPAVMLFEAVAQSVLSSFTLTATNSALVVRICTRLDGLPLGIELAAAQVTRYSLTELLRAISRPDDKIRSGFFAPLVAGRPRRHWSLADAISWSYDRLDAPVQMLFRRLGIFAGEFDAAAAEGICDAPQNLGIDVLNGLLLLLDHHLLEAVAVPDDDLPPRFTMLTVIRDFSRDLLATRGELPTMRARHAGYYAALISQQEADFVGAAQVLRLKTFTRDYPNITAALRHARDQHDAPLGLHLIGSLWWYWEKRRTLTEGRGWIEQILALVAPQQEHYDHALLGRAYYSAGVLANAQGDAPQAQHYGQHCLDHCLAAGDVGRIGQAYALLGAIAHMAGKDAAALREYEQALVALRQVDTPRQLVSVLNNVSALAIGQGDFARAHDFLEESLALKRYLGDQRGIAVGLINLGEWHKQQGDFTQALARIAAAEQIFSDLGDQVGMAMAANNAGEIAIARNDWPGAIAALSRSLAYFQQGENQVGIAMVQCYLGDAYLAAGEPVAALVAWQASLTAQPQGPHAEHCHEALSTRGHAPHSPL